jgi:hypothetical protein
MKVLKMNECYYHRSENGNTYEEFKIKSVDWIGDEEGYTLFYNGNEELTHQSIYKRVGEDFVKVCNKDFVYVVPPKNLGSTWINDKELGVIEVVLAPTKARLINCCMEAYEYEFSYKGERYTRRNPKHFPCKKLAEEAVDKEVINIDGTKEIVIGINEMLRLTAEQKEAVQELKEAVQKLEKLNVGIAHNEDDGFLYFLNENGLEVISDDLSDDDNKYYIDSSCVRSLSLEHFRIADLSMNGECWGIYVKRK